MTDLSPESAEAVHKAKNAAQAVELAREAQIAEALSKYAEANRQSTIDALKEVFGESDTENPTQMKILVRRIPILCTNIANMHQDIADMKDNMKWVVRVVLGAVLIAILKLVLLG